MESLDLEEFTPDNCASFRGRVAKAKFSMNIKTGLLSFNKELVAQLDLKEDNHIIFHQNKNKPSDWYLEICDSGGFKLRPSANKKTLDFNNVSLVRRIYQSADFTEMYGSCGVSITKIASGTRILYAVITAMLKEQTNTNEASTKSGVSKL